MTEKKNITEKAFTSVNLRLTTKNLLVKIAEETGMKNFAVMDKALKKFVLDQKLHFEV